MIIRELTLEQPTFTIPAESERAAAMLATAVGRPNFRVSLSLFLEALSKISVLDHIIALVELERINKKRIEANLHFIPIMREDMEEGSEEYASAIDDVSRFELAIIMTGRIIAQGVNPMCWPLTKGITLEEALKETNRVFVTRHKQRRKFGITHAVICKKSA